MISDTEHRLLEDYASRNSKTIEQVLQEAIRKTVLKDTITPNDSLFVEPPSSRKMRKKMDDASSRHDTYLYGRKR